MRKNQLLWFECSHFYGTLTLNCTLNLFIYTLCCNGNGKYVKYIEFLSSQLKRLMSYDSFASHNSNGIIPERMVKLWNCLTHFAHTANNGIIKKKHDLTTELFAFAIWIQTNTHSRISISNKVAKIYVDGVSEYRWVNMLCWYCLIHWTQEE